MSTSLLVEYFNQLPERRAKENAAEWRTRRESAKEIFRKRVGERYTEGTLLRLLECADVLSRRAALLALSLVGSMGANAAVAACLHDGDTDYLYGHLHRQKQHHRSQPNDRHCI